MEFPRYISYKDSGIDWVGDIPALWEVERAKWLFKKMERSVRPDDEVVTAFRDGTVTLRINRRTEGFTTALQEHGYQGIRKGDLVIHAMDAFAGAIGVSDSDGKATPVYAACVNRGEYYTNNHYYAYLLRYMSKVGYIESLAKGIRERSTDFRFNDFAKLNLPIPPRDEQDRIANFLDQKTAEIDEAIAKKQRLIELLKEQKAILINQAVTKGLNSDVPMRDSGVEWIGEVPAHWNVVRLKHISNKVTDGEHISPKTIENGIPLLSAKDVRERYILFEAAAYVSESDARKFRRRCNPERGDILIVSRGATVGRIGLVETDQEFCLMGSVILVKPKDDVDPGFLYYSLNQEDVQRSILQTSDASAQQAVYLIDVKETVICIPPMQEQVTIYNRIQPQIEEIDHAINLQFRKIASLTEIKAVYISSAVTGKIKI